MKKITDFDVKNKRVLVRCNFDVPLDKQGKILDDFRIEKTMPTIKYLLRRRAKIILMSHLGRPKGRFKQKLSLSVIQERLTEYLDCSIVKADDCAGEKIEEWAQEMQPGEILLLENLRFHSGEEENNRQFAQRISRLGDIYINEAFSASHGQHASLVGVPDFLPSGIGFLFEKEIKALYQVLKSSQRPVVGVIGGDKLIKKIRPIKGLLRKVDFLLIGGKIANTLLAARDRQGKEDLFRREIIEITKEIDLYDSKLRLPMDVVVLKDGKMGISNASKAGNEKVFDIGPKTRKTFSEIIKKSRVIFWAGPLGKIDEKLFVNGSLETARAISESDSYSVAGGGDTIAFLKNNNLIDNIDHICTGGSAMLEFLSTGTLPAIEALGAN